ncbi:hypothetical protein LMH87_003545 [Akanthomyces muscarius]|uniref:Uncharacterized protein n=1 Tax=Akanthomyces muscarius TaxID=2231603 RepID=A0A9W8Q3H8_AKAMU|nr:hypothetical protein LMH87_003545 [Akanthomyces muscarius]KAJ4144671.1 hypothetical protein LMH87_003545 [Akanthomyces muscarius]
MFTSTIQYRLRKNPMLSCHPASPPSGQDKDVAALQAENKHALATRTRLAGYSSTLQRIGVLPDCYLAPPGNSYANDTHHRDTCGAIIICPSSSGQPEQHHHEHTQTSIEIFEKP